MECDIIFSCESEIVGTLRMVMLTGLRWYKSIPTRSLAASCVSIQDVCRAAITSRQGFSTMNARPWRFHDRFHIPSQDYRNDQRLSRLSWQPRSWRDRCASTPSAAASSTSTVRNPRKDPGPQAREAEMQASTHVDQISQEKRSKFRLQSRSLQPLFRFKPPSPERPLKRSRDPI